MSARKFSANLYSHLPTRGHEKPSRVRAKPLKPESSITEPAYGLAVLAEHHEQRCMLHRLG